MATRKRPPNALDELQAKVHKDAENGVDLTPAQQISVDEAAAGLSTAKGRRRAAPKKVIGVAPPNPNRRVIDERGRVKQTLTWEQRDGTWVAVETDAVLASVKIDGQAKWTTLLWGTEAGRFATLSGAKAFAADAFNLDPAAMGRTVSLDPEQTGEELRRALANLGENGEPLDNIVDLDNRRDAVVGRARDRLLRLNAAKTATAKHKAAEAATGRKVPVTEADVDAVRQNLADQRAGQRRAADEINKTVRKAKRAAEREANPKAPPGEGRSSSCPLCGFEFSAPKARCSSSAACAKRAAERGGPPAKAAGPTKKAPAKKATGPAKKAPAKKAPAKKATHAFDPETGRTIAKKGAAKTTK